MFAIIDLKGATHIAIHIPHQGSEKSLPALAAMLEKNSVFINKSYYDMKTVKAEMQISLSNEYQMEKSGDEEVIIRIPESDEVISPDFVIASPDVFASNAKGLKKRDEEIAKIKKELEYARFERDELKAKIQELAEGGE